MKNILISTLIFSTLFSFQTNVFAQIPKGISYQAVARDGSGNVLGNQNVRLQISVLEGTAFGTPVYVESHLVSTNPLGLFTLVIGKGTPSFGTFSSVIWVTNDKYLKVELDPNGGTNYLNMGTSQLLSVPYAMAADTALKGDRWGGQTVQTDQSLSGAGTTGLPLKLNSQGATQGQILKWNGTGWAAANDEVSGNGQPLVVSPRISGNGTSNSPLDIAGQNASLGQVLKWNGVSWAPGADQIGGNYVGISPITINGNNISLTNGTGSGQALMWNGSAWAPQFIQLPNFTSGNGININGNTISSTLWTENGGNIYRNGGSVGIGTNNPTAQLDVRANSSLSYPQLWLTENENDFARLSFSNTASDYTWAVVGRPENSNTEGRLNFFYSKNNLDVMSLTHYGSVGIGTVDPEFDARLQVNTGNKYAGLFLGDFPDNSATVINAQYDGTGFYDAVAVAGQAEPAYGKGFGGQFYGGNTGVYGLATAGSFNGQYAAIGAYGESFYDQGGFPQAGSTRTGVYGYGRGGDYSFGVYGTHDGSANNNYAGYFEGNVTVIGGMSKSFGTFKIDHPLDPENKYLYHSFVESPDMMNIYNGVAITDDAGTALVELPAYFEALNREFRYQLTTIGRFANVYIEKEIENNRFSIKSDKPNVKISWQVTGVRKDPVAEKYRVQAEVDKKGVEKGRYLHPEVYNQPYEKSLQALFKPAPVKRQTKVERKRNKTENVSIAAPQTK